MSTPGGIKEDMIKIMKENEEEYTDPNILNFLEAQRDEEDEPEKKEESSIEIKSDSEEDSIDEQESEEGKKEDTEGTAAAESEDEVTLLPPVHWKPEDKEAFVKLSEMATDDASKKVVEQLQNTLVNRNKEMESHFTKRTQEISQDRKEFEVLQERYKSYDDVVNSYNDTLTKRGITDVSRHVAEMLRLDQFAHEDPVEFAKQWIRIRGISPEQLGIQSSNKVTEYVVLDEAGNPLYTVPVNENDQVANQPQANPQTQRGTTNTQYSMDPRVLHELQELKSQIGSIQSSSQEKVAQQAQRDLDNFISAKDAAGNELHPFYTDVKDSMATFIKSNSELSLADAYAAAVAIRPDLQSKIQENNTVAARIAQQKRDAQEALKAKKASVSLKTNSAQSADASDKIEDMELRDQLNVIYNQQMQSGRI